MNENKNLSQHNFDKLIADTRANPASTWAILNRRMPQQFFNYQKSNQIKLAEVDFPVGLIPDKYLCESNETIMDNPVRLPDTDHIWDKNSVLQHLQHSKNRIHPYNPGKKI